MMGEGSSSKRGRWIMNMKRQSPAGIREAGASSAHDPQQWRLRLLRVAGGDAVLAAALRGMLWHEYCAAGRLCGASEEGMFRWLAGEPAAPNLAPHVGSTSDQTPSAQ